MKKEHDVPSQDKTLLKFTMYFRMIDHSEPVVDLHIRILDASGPVFSFSCSFGHPLWDILDPQIHSKLTNREIIILLCSFLVHVNHSLKFHNVFELLIIYLNSRHLTSDFYKMTSFVTISHDALGPTLTPLDTRHGTYSLAPCY